MSTVPAIIEAGAAIGTILLALFAYFEVRGGRRERRVANLGREVELVTGAEDPELIPAITSLVERWWHDPLLAKHMLKMKERYEEKREGFYRDCRELREDIRVLKRRMNAAHPNTLFPGDVEQRIASTHYSGGPDLSWKRFYDLFWGAELDRRERSRYSPPPDIVHDTPPHDRKDIYAEEVPIEQRLLDLIDMRLDHLWYLKKNMGGSDVDDEIQKEFNRLNMAVGQLRRQLADWKTGAPERSMWELIALAAVFEKWVVTTDELGIDDLSWSVPFIGLGEPEVTIDYGLYRKLLRTAYVQLRLEVEQERSFL